MAGVAWPVAESLKFIGRKNGVLEGTPGDAIKAINYATASKPCINLDYQCELGHAISQARDHCCGGQPACCCHIAGNGGEDSFAICDHTPIIRGGSQDISSLISVARSTHGKLPLYSNYDPKRRVAARVVCVLLKRYYSPAGGGTATPLAFDVSPHVTGTPR